MWGRGQPASWAQTFEPRREIRQKQARAVQAVTLAHAQDRVTDRFEAQGERLGGEVLDRPLSDRLPIAFPAVDFGAAQISRARSISKLKREQHVVPYGLEIQFLLGWQGVHELLRDQPRQQSRRGFVPRRGFSRLGAWKHADDPPGCFGGVVVVLVASNPLEPSQVDAGTVVEVDRELELRFDGKVGARTVQLVSKDPNDTGDRTVGSGLPLRHREVLGQAFAGVIGIQSLLNRAKRIEPAEAPQLHPVAAVTLVGAAAQMVDQQKTKKRACALDKAIVFGSIAIAIDEILEQIGEPADAGRPFPG